MFYKKLEISLLEYELDRISICILYLIKAQIVTKKATAVFDSFASVCKSSHFFPKPQLFLPFFSNFFHSFFAAEFIALALRFESSITSSACC
jgi:hypothetical protein